MPSPRTKRRPLSRSTIPGRSIHPKNNAIFSDSELQVVNLAGGSITGQYGVFLKSGTVASTVVNYGRISALNETAVDLQLHTISSSVKPAGAVTNKAGTYIGGGKYGVSIGGGPAYITNAGTIKGQNRAVRFGSGFFNTVIFQPGATFAGVVDGGNPLGNATYSTLELASGASTGKLSGLGTRYINFSRINLDLGATWVLDATSTILNQVTMTNSGALVGAVGTSTGTAGGAGTVASRSPAASATPEARPAAPARRERRAPRSSQATWAARAALGSCWSRARRTTREA